MVAALGRFPTLAWLAETVPVPDLIPSRNWPIVRAAIKLVNWNPSRAVCLLPEARYILLLRHPCGQIASFLAGVAEQRFHATGVEAGQLIDIEAAEAIARDRGVAAAAFRDLPTAAKCAWAWLAFNEPAVLAMRGLPNTRIVIYEELCRDPQTAARDLFDFTQLSWSCQTSSFLQVSTHTEGFTDYYDVFRSTSQVAERWRETMSSEDQATVREVIATSPLARFWKDLARTP
jgi:hypothetical protein